MSARRIDSFWSNEDPRIYFSNCNRYGGEILILRPNNTDKHAKHLVGEGDIYVEDFWDIFTSFEDYKKIDVDMEWDPSWWWIETIDIRFEMAQ